MAKKSRGKSRGKGKKGKSRGKSGSGRKSGSGSKTNPCKRSAGKTNPWIKFLCAYAKKNNMKYPDVLAQAGKSTKIQDAYAKWSG